MPPLLVAGLAWALTTFVWTPFILGWFVPFLSNALRHLPAGPPQATAGAVEVAVLLALLSGLLTAAAEALMPLVVYLVLVRPQHLAPVLGRRPPTLWALGFSVIAVVGAAAYAASQGAFTGVASAISLLTFVVAVGLCEEYSYRGVLTRVTKDRLGILPAALIVSIAFGLSHVWEAHFVDGLTFNGSALWGYLGSTALFGLAATWVAWRSGSLLWVAVLHGLNDWLGSTMFTLSSMIGLVVVAAVGTEILRIVWMRNQGPSNSTVGM